MKGDERILKKRDWPAQLGQKDWSNGAIVENGERGSGGFLSRDLALVGGLVLFLIVVPKAARRLAARHGRWTD